MHGGLRSLRKNKNLVLIEIYSLTTAATDQMSVLPTEQRFTFRPLLEMEAGHHATV